MTAALFGGPGATAVAASGLGVQFVSEAFDHGKAIASIGEGSTVLHRTQIGNADHAAEAVAVAGVITAAAGVDVSKVAAAFIDAIGKHRHFDRQTESVPA